MNTKLNKSDWILLLIIFGVTIAFSSYNYYLEDNALIEYLIDFPTEMGLSIVIIITFIRYIIPEFLVKSKRYVLFMLISIVFLSIIGSIDKVIGNLTAGNDITQLGSVFSFLLSGLYNAIDMGGFPLAVLLVKKFYEGQSELIAVQKQQKENELKLLRSQIDPHFLFNNLNTLDSLIDSDSDKAKEYINRLSLIYRYLIQTKDAEVMELEKEINFAENYIFLIETRFGSDYTFTIHKKTTIKDKFIPTGALQTLLENVVKHNKAGLKNIETTIVIDDDWLSVKNNKQNNPNKDSLGTGLQNLQTRYQLLSDKKVDIKDTNTQFLVSIPLIKLSDEK